MKNLVAKIEARLAELGWQQKQLAIEWQKQVGKGSISTYETRLSKLMNDEADGLDFILDEREPERLPALAKCLGWTNDALRTDCERERSRKTLILHPQLSTDRKAFLVKRAELSAGEFVCVEATSADRDALRDLAKKSRNAVVVLVNDRDSEFFQGAGVGTSTLEPASFGFNLVRFSALTRPLPAKLRDDDGTLMLPDTETVNHYRNTRINRESYVRQHGAHLFPPSEFEQGVEAQLEQAKLSGLEPTFRAPMVFSVWGVVPERDDIVRLLLDAATTPLRQTHPIAPLNIQRREFLWVQGGAVLSICKPTTTRRDQVAKYHPVHEVTTFDPLVAALSKLIAGLNPLGWSDGPVVLPELTAFVEETGLKIDLGLGTLRNLAFNSRGSVDTTGWVAARKDEAAAARVRQATDELLGREFSLPEDKLLMVFELELLKEASLLHLPSTENRLEFMANGGEGQFARGCVRFFPSEPPQPVRYVYDSGFGGLDGGNLSVALRWGFRDAFHGPQPPARVKKGT